jgi:hypothetical protein
MKALELGRVHQHDRARITGDVISIDSERRAVAIAATPALLKTFDGHRLRILVTEEAIEIDRMKGAPVLADHFQTVDSILGCVNRCWIHRQQFMVEFTFARHAEKLRDMWQDGLTLKCSLGFNVLEARPLTDAVKVATCWQPYELSIVALGADPFARVLSPAEAEEAFRNSESVIEASRQNARLKATKAARSEEWRDLAREAAASLPPNPTAEQIEAHLAILVSSKIDKINSDIVSENT